MSRKPFKINDRLFAINWFAYLNASQFMVYF